MDTRSILLLVAAAWLVVSHIGDMVNLGQAVASWFVGLFRRPDPDPVAKSAGPSMTPVCELVASYIRLKPHLAAEQAKAAWAVIEPADVYRYSSSDYQDQPDVSSALALVSAWTLLRPYLTADQARATWAALESALPQEAKKP